MDKRTNIQYRIITTDAVYAYVESGSEVQLWRQVAGFTIPVASPPSNRKRKNSVA
jgi:hypothetical protein